MGDSRTIWKYEMSSPDATIDLPWGAHVCAVGQQDGVVVFWAEVDPREERRVGRRFLAVWTGTEYPSRCDYLGTVQMPNGIVWHLVEGYPSVSPGEQP